MKIESERNRKLKKWYGKETRYTSETGEIPTQGNFFRTNGSENEGHNLIDVLIGRFSFLFIVNDEKRISFLAGDPILLPDVV